MLDDLFHRLSERLESSLEVLDEDLQAQLGEAEQYLRHGDFEEAADVLEELAETAQEAERMLEAGELYLLVADCYRRADELEDANEYGTEAIQCFLAAESFDRAEEVLSAVLQGLEEADEVEEARRLRRQVERIIGGAPS